MIGIFAPGVATVLTGALGALTAGLSFSQLFLSFFLSCSISFYFQSLAIIFIKNRILISLFRFSFLLSCKIQSFRFLFIYIVHSLSLSFICFPPSVNFYRSLFIFFFVYLSRSLACSLSIPLSLALFISLTYVILYL